MTPLLPFLMPNTSGWEILKEDRCSQPRWYGLDVLSWRVGPTSAETKFLCRDDNHLLITNNASKMNGHSNGHANGNGKLHQLPNDMFHVIRSTGTAARLGRLALPGRRILDTPHYLANTSRGVVPHITQDTFVRDTNLSGLYIALEDCECPFSRCCPSAPIC